jgi:extracellular matrix protein 14
MDLMSSMFPSFVSNVDIGQSYENRPIRGLRIATADDQQADNTPRKVMVLVGGMHAREWISTTTVNYISWSLISSLLSRDRIISDFLEEFEVVLIPALNPDGIEYSWNGNRLWRKTRQPSSQHSRCQGFDLDHAFEYGWDGGNRHNHPCSDSFGGAYGPFEPAEARALANWALNVTAAGNRRIVSVLDLHSYSQQILYPMASTCNEPPNLENLEELAFGIAKTIRQTKGQHYDVMSACEGLTSQRRGDADGSVPRRSLVEYGGGSMVDWFFHYMGAHYSYQLKLRDTGSYGFLLPKEFIRPTGREIFNAVRYMADYLMGNNGIERAYRPPRKGKGAVVEGKSEERKQTEGSEQTEGAPKAPVQLPEHPELRRRQYL